jgi:hypothetical protein
MRERASIMTTSTAKRRPPTPEEINQRQKEDAANAKAANPTSTAVVPATPASTAVAKPGNADPVQAYLDVIAPTTMVGRLIKFTKDGVFTTDDDGAAINEDEDFIALCDETQIGWIKFNGAGNPPDKHLGLLYDGFAMPTRASLGDNDESSWPDGLDKHPADPWLHQMNLVLQHAETRELFTYSTTSSTGRRAIGNLLKHYNRQRKTNPDEVPVIKLKSGGFEHKDSRVGWVNTPVFAVVGKTARSNAAKPDTSVKADMDDAIPF